MILSYIFITITTILQIIIKYKTTKCYLLLLIFIYLLFVYHILTNIYNNYFLFIKNAQNILVYRTAYNINLCYYIARVANSYKITTFERMCCFFAVPIITKLLLGNTNRWHCLIFWF